MRTKKPFPPIDVCEVHGPFLDIGGPIFEQRDNIDRYIRRKVKNAVTFKAIEKAINPRARQRSLGDIAAVQTMFDANVIAAMDE